MRTPLLSRRGALLGLGAAVTFGHVSLAMAAAPTDRRLIVVILRGALDGMAAVAPYGDAAFAGLRGELNPKPPALAKGLLAAHLGLDQAALLRAFPSSQAAAPVSGLIRAT